MAQFNLDNYVDVQERINRFWAEYPEGAILTDIMSPPNELGEVLIKAAVYQHRTDPIPTATGFAHEVHGASPVNRTSHVENCDTSAVGRALANMGYAKTASERPSRQEMEKVQRMQEPPAIAAAPRPPAPTPMRPADQAEPPARGKVYGVKPWADAMTDSQKTTIQRIAYDIGLAGSDGSVSDEMLYELLANESDNGTFGGESLGWPMLSKGQASAAIEYLKDRTALLKGGR